MSEKPDPKAENRQGTGVNYAPTPAPSPAQWEKGGPSPNPKGRPKTSKEEREAFQEWVPQARAFLVKVLHDKRVSTETRLKAAKEILDRALGKPSQPIVGEDGGPVKVTFDDVRGNLGERLGRLKHDGDPKSGPGQPSADEDPEQA